MEVSGPLSEMSLRTTLPSDILIMVLEDPHHLSSTSFSMLRLVSRQFDALIVPILYRSVRLTSRVVRTFANPETLTPDQLQVGRDVREHTRTISIDEILDWSLVTKMLETMNLLKSLT